MRIPFLRPRPPQLSKLVQELQAIEASGVFSNYGPVNKRFETALTERVFGGVGQCLTVVNATIGLMLAIREAVGEPTGRGRIKGGGYALMPSFTFAAVAQAAIWAGLTPLLCDIDPETWTSWPKAEDILLRQYAGQIACVVPYATFGNCINLDRYKRLGREFGVGIVVDAAASLGSVDEQGRGFGTGFPYPIVFFMHATKSFAVGEAGVIYCSDAERLSRLRAMGNFGFREPRIAAMPGLNAKLSEVGSLLALAKLEHFDEVVAHRARLAQAYRARLPGLGFQLVVGHQLAYQFMPVLLPRGWAAQRPALLAALAERGIGVAHYFSPHLAEHPYFADVAVAGALSVTQDIAGRVLSLPLSDEMTLDEVDEVSSELLSFMRKAA